MADGRQRKGLLSALGAALGLDQQLLSPEHWIKIYGAKQAPSSTRAGRGRNRIAETAFQAGAWLLAEAVEGDGRPTLGRLSWESFARAALIDPGMADAYLMLFMLRVFAPKNVDPLDLLDALRLTSSRLRQEQRRFRFPVHVHYAPLGFTEVEITTATDCSLAYTTELILRGRYQEAETVLADLQPDSELTEAVRARLAFNTGGIDEAEELLNHVIDGSRLLRPDGHWMRGIIRMGREDYDQARADFETAEAESLDRDCTRSCREALAYLCAETGDEEGEKHWIAKLSETGPVPAFLGGDPIEEQWVEPEPEEIEAVEGVDYVEVDEGDSASTTQLRSGSADAGPVESEDARESGGPDTSPLMSRDAGTAGARYSGEEPERVDPDLWRQVLQAFEGPPADDPTVE